MQIQTGTGRQHTAISDGILVQQSLAGNQDAFAALIHRYSIRLNRNHVFHFSELEEGYDENELPIIEAIPDSDPLPEDLAEYRELQQCLHQAIQTLPVKARAVVLLRYEGHFTFPEIGQILHLPTATVKTYFQRAKPHLRKALLAVLPYPDSL